VRLDPQDVELCLGHGEDLEAREGSISPPIVQTSLFAHRNTASLMAALSDEFAGRVYSRGRNPTVQALERLVAALEGGEAALGFGSGMGAISAAFMGVLQAGDRVLFVNQVYGPTLQLARQLARFGVRHDVLLDTDPAAIRRALEPETRLVWFESPGTMLFGQLDVRDLVAAARERGALTAIDNSWATPLLQKPLSLGVDLVAHTCTKYLAGHSDTVAGALVGSEALLRQVFERAYMLGGAVLSPLDAWLVIRGMRTLPARLERHEASALVRAEWLLGHPRVRRVFHPAFDPPPGPGDQLAGWSGLFSLELDTGEHRDVARFLDALRRFRLGVSWGGVESLAITPNRGSNAEALAASGLPAGLVRLSVGLEPVDSLRADLERALETLP